MNTYNDWNTWLNTYFEKNPEISFFMAKGWVLHLASEKKYSDELVADFVYACTEYWLNGKKNLDTNYVLSQSKQDIKNVTAFLSFLSLAWHHDFHYVDDGQKDRETRDDAYYGRLTDMIRWAYDFLGKEIPEDILNHSVAVYSYAFRKIVEEIYEKNNMMTIGSDRFVEYPRVHAKYSSKELEKHFEDLSCNPKKENEDPRDQLLEDFYTSIGGIKNLHWDISNGKITLLGDLYGAQVTYQYTCRSGHTGDGICKGRFSFEETDITELKINGKKMEIPNLASFGTKEKPFYIFYVRDNENHLLNGKRLTARRITVYGNHNRLTLDEQVCEPVYVSTNNSYRKYDFSGLIQSGGELKADGIPIANCGFLPGLVVSGLRYSDYSLMGVDGIFLFDKKEEREITVYKVNCSDPEKITVMPEDYNRRKKITYGDIAKTFIFAVPDNQEVTYSDESFRKGKCFQKCGDLRLVKPIEEPVFSWQKGLDELKDFNQSLPKGINNEDKLNLKLHIFVPDDKKIEIMLDENVVKEIAGKVHYQNSIRNILSENKAPWKENISLKIRQADALEKDAKELLTLDWVPVAPCFFQENENVYLFPANLQENPEDEEDQWSVWIAKDGPKLSAEEILPENLSSEIIRGKKCYKLDHSVLVQPENGGGIRLYVVRDGMIIASKTLFEIQDNFDYYKAMNELDTRYHERKTSWMREFFSPITDKKLSYADRIMHDFSNGINILFNDFDNLAQEDIDSLQNTHQKNIFISLPAIRKLKIHRKDIPGLENFLQPREVTGLFFRILESKYDTELYDFHFPVKSSPEKLLLLPDNRPRVSSRNNMLIIQKRVWGYHGWKNSWLPIFLSLPPDDDAYKVFFKYIVDEDLQLDISIKEQEQLEPVWQAMNTLLHKDCNTHPYANLSRIFALIWLAYDKMSPGRKMIAAAAVYCRMFAWHIRFQKEFPLESKQSIITAFVQRIWNSSDDKVLELFASDILVTEFFFTWCNDPRYEYLGNSQKGF